MPVTIRTPEGDVEVDFTHDMVGNCRVSLHVRSPFVAELAPSSVRRLVDALLSHDRRAQKANEKRKEKK